MRLEVDVGEVAAGFGGLGTLRLALRFGVVGVCSCAFEGFLSSVLVEGFLVNCAFELLGFNDGAGFVVVVVVVRRSFAGDLS